MNKKKTKFSYLLLTLFIACFYSSQVFAACKDFGNSGKDTCILESESGYKCEYDVSKKGAARCFKGKIAVDETIVVEPEDNATDNNSNKPCNIYASEGKSVCEEQSVDGYKCAWDSNKKGGSRCYKSKNLTEEKKNEIGSSVKACSDIKEGSEVCNNSKVNGIQCFYTHGQCANKTDSDGSSDTQIGDGSSNNGNSNTTNNNGGTSTTRVNNTDSSLYTGCPLGKDVTKDLYGALKIFKIVAPLLVIGFTVFEFVQALAKGDITAELKKLSQRLLKRCIYAVILFFLPVLVNQVMQLANVWDENGTCDFSDSVEVKPDDSRTEDERRVTSCGGHTDLTSCNNDTTNHCTWSYSGNYCERVKCGDFGDNSTCTKNGCSWSYSGNFCEYKKQ